MSEPVRTASAEVLITGRCIQVRKAGDSFLHLVAMPAPDPYSHPSTVEVMAGERLCDREETFSARCRVKGYPRTYKATDRDTGEQKTVRTADVKLEAIA